MAKYVFEVIDAAKAAKTRKEKIEILKKNESWALKDVLRGTLDPVVKWDLPTDEAPPYEASDDYNHPSNLLRENTKFKYFVRGPISQQLMKAKRESIFIGLLEAVHPADARLLVDMINKKPFKDGITPALVNEAFPELIKG